MPPVDSAAGGEEVISVGVPSEPDLAPGSVAVIEEEDPGVPSGNVQDDAAARSAVADDTASEYQPEPSATPEADDGAYVMTPKEREAALKTLEELDSVKMGTTQKVMLVCVVVLIIVMALYVLMYWGVIPSVIAFLQPGSQTGVLLLT